MGSPLVEPRPTLFLFSLSPSRDVAAFQVVAAAAVVFRFYICASESCRGASEQHVCATCNLRVLRHSARRQQQPLHGKQRRLTLQFEVPRISLDILISVHHPQHPIKMSYISYIVRVVKSST